MSDQSAPEEDPKGIRDRVLKTSGTSWSLIVPLQPLRAVEQLLRVPPHHEAVFVNARLPPEKILLPSPRASSNNVI